MSYLYSIKDTKLGKFYPPTVYQNDEDAKRSIRDVMTYAGESMLARHPEDFQLFKVGCWFDESGVIEYLYDQNEHAINNYLVICCDALTKPNMEVVK